LWQGEENRRGRSGEKESDSLDQGHPVESRIVKSREKGRQWVRRRSKGGVQTGKGRPKAGQGGYKLTLYLNQGLRMTGKKIKGVEEKPAKGVDRQKEWESMFLPSRKKKG